MSIDRPSEVDPDELEAEREFLLKSLDDLDSELLAGNIDPDNYRVLHDDYTARAAAVIKSIDDGVNRKTPAEARRSTVMKYVTIFAVDRVLRAGRRARRQDFGTAPLGRDHNRVTHAAVHRCPEHLRGAHAGRGRRHERRQL